MSDCTFAFTPAELASQGGIVPQISHFKPPREGASYSAFLDEEKDATSLFQVHPSLQRLDSSSEEGGNISLGAATVPTTSGDTRENSTRATPIFGNDLDVLRTPVQSPSAESVPQLSIPTGTPVQFPSAESVPQLSISTGTPVQSPSAAESVPQVSISTFSQSGASTADVRECVRLGVAADSPAVVNNVINSDDWDVSMIGSVNPFECKNGGALSSDGCLSPNVVPPNSGSSSSSNNNDNSTNNSSNNNSNSASGQAFPSEPSILANKYIILGPVDASTSHAIYIKNHQPLHVKAVSLRTALEVCAQQGLLGECDGVRAPFEAVVSRSEKRAWLLFPPHYGDLHSYVRLRRRLREAEAQRLFVQVARTVERCHTSGLVLRDLKLRKFVFTDPNGQNVVLESVEDSVVAGESDLLHDKHGCPAYVAPEILSAAAYSGRHADMWGLGVILYTMLVGRYPFHNADTNTLFARIRSGKFLIPDWVSSRARHLILSLLRRQPHRRLSAKQVLLHPWLNRSPRDHVGKEPLDHIVPSTEHRTLDYVSSNLGKM